MLAVQHHRGPDGEGQWLSDGGVVGLCHSRLAILDLSDSGRQPMHDAAGDLAITFNGEIFNWPELRHDLAAKGYTFRGHSDTEVLLYAYREYGDAVLERLRGMFAFAIHDRRDGSLFCARDRVGKKPFVYAESPSGFFFASEIPALVSAPGLDLALDQAALAGMLLKNMRHIADPSTAYKSIRRLRPGHAMRVRGGRIESIWRWWTPAADQGPHTPARLRELFEECTRARMVADVPVGALLSGGVDSTAIVSVMQRASREPVRTYALGMDKNDEDLRRARLAAERLGCIHREFYFDAERQLTAFQALMQALGEPIMLLPLVHAFELCNAIHADGIRVVLAGHGADEIFYGYGGHVRAAGVSDLLAPVDAVLSLLQRKAPSPARPAGALGFLLAGPGRRKGQHYRNAQAASWDQVITAGAQRDLRNVVAEELEYWGALSPSRTYIDESNFCGLMVENTHSVTTSADLPAMLASVEIRAPFLDVEMLKFAYGVHYRRKVPYGRTEGRLKLILKQALADLVPADLLYAPKRGFGSGIQEEGVLRDRWQAFGGSFLEDPDDLDGLLDCAGIRAMWRRFLKGDSAHTATLTRLVAIQYWAREVRAHSHDDFHHHVGRALTAGSRHAARAP